MLPKKLVKSSHPLIHTKLEPFDFKSDVDPVELKNHLVEMMYDHKGIGLSANQIGLPHRVFVMRSENDFACFNPSITYYSDDQIVMEEGCLTYPLLYVKIKRATTIRAKYYDEFGVLHTERFTGMTARIFQHEFDHMEGIDYMSHASKLHLNVAKKNHRLLMRKLKKANNQPKRIMEEEVNE